MINRSIIIVMESSKRVFCIRSLAPGELNYCIPVENINQK